MTKLENNGKNGLLFCFNEVNILYNTNLKKIADRYFDNNLLATLSSSITKAYHVLDSLIKEHEFLQFAVGKDARPYLKRVLVDYYLTKLCQNNPSIKYQINKNKAKNCSHVELLLGPFILTASNVEDFNSIPRKAIFRDDLSQLNIDFEQKESQGVLFQSEEIYGIITHAGYKTTPSFINLGFPDSNNSSWLHYRDLEIKPVSFDTPIEEIKDEILISFKQEIRTIQESS